MRFSILSILFSGSTERGALERFYVFNPVDHTTADFRNRGQSPVLLWVLPVRLGSEKVRPQPRPFRHYTHITD